MQRQNGRNAMELTSDHYKRLMENAIAQREDLKAQVEALRAEVTRLNEERGRDPDGRLSHPTPKVARASYLAIRKIVQDLPLDGIGANDLTGRVQFLVDQFRALNPHAQLCFFQEGEWQCFAPCPHSRCVKAGCEGGVCCTPRYCIVEDHDSRIEYRRIRRLAPWHGL